MKHHLRSAAAVASLMLAAPAVGLASDDGDIFPGDPAALTTVVAADGTITHGTASPSSRSFVASLVAQRARGGVLRLDTSSYSFPTVIRTGYAKPATALAPLQGRSRAARGAVTVRWTTQADGTRTMERGYAVEIATGKIRRIAIDTARRLSADPASGRAGLAYQYHAESGLPAGAPFG